MPSDPPDPDLSTAEGLEIDIDPELIAAAVSSVQSLGAAKKRKKKATFMPSRHNEEVGDPETVDLEVELGLPCRRCSGGLAGAQAVEERPDPEALLFELVWSTIRHVDGVDRERVRAATGWLPRVPGAAVAAGLVVESPASIRLLPAGFAVSDAVARSIVRTTLTAGV